MQIYGQYWFIYVGNKVSEIVEIKHIANFNAKSA